VFPLEKLYALCEIARKYCDPYRIGRVIARPFIGEAGTFTRTSGRHDYSLVPPATVLDRLPVTGVGKIGDIFAARGIDTSHPTKSNADGMATIERLWPELQEGLMFVNLVDFDSLFGHRRDPEGYANCLAEFDAWLGKFLPQVDPEDLLIITADHGNDPTWTGTDHTREQVPLLTLHGDAPASCSGEHDSFTAIAHLLEQHFQLGSDA
jgi:phosphopentomutase